MRLIQLALPLQLLELRKCRELCLVTTTARPNLLQQIIGTLIDVARIRTIFFVSCSTVIHLIYPILPKWHRLLRIDSSPSSSSSHWVPVLISSRKWVLKNLVGQVGASSRLSHCSLLNCLLPCSTLFTSRTSCLWR